MSNLQVFNNSEFGDIRTTLIGNEPYLMLNDVCNILEISNPRDVKSRLNLKGVATTDILTVGGVQQATFINEPNFYKVVFQSRKPQAEQFTEWVTSEVLPSIRKHGAYMTPEKIEEALLNPDTLIKLATSLKAEQEKRALAERQIEEMKPKALFADAWQVSEKSILVGEMAKLLARNGLEDMGQNRFFKWLRDSGYLHKGGEQYNLPTQRSTELEILEVKTTTIANPDGSLRVTKTPKVTVKGQMYFLNKFREREIA